LTVTTPGPMGNEGEVDSRAVIRALTGTPLRPGPRITSIDRVVRAFAGRRQQHDNPSLTSSGGIGTALQSGTLRNGSRCSAPPASGCRQTRVRGTTTVGSHAEAGVRVESVAIQTSIGSGNRVGLWPRLGEGPRGPTRREAGQEGQISPLDWPV